MREITIEGGSTTDRVSQCSVERLLYILSGDALAGLSPPDALHPSVGLFKTDEAEGLAATKTALHRGVALRVPRGWALSIKLLDVKAHLKYLEISCGEAIGDQGA